jgi:hypothetical protein
VYEDLSNSAQMLGKDLPEMPKREQRFFRTSLELLPRQGTNRKSGHPQADVTLLFYLLLFSMPS